MESRTITPAAVAKVDLLSLIGTIKCLLLHVLMELLGPESRFVLWLLFHQAI